MIRSLTLILLFTSLVVAACDDEPWIEFPDTDPPDADGDSDADGDVSDDGCQSDEECSDNIDCTADRCDRATGLCEHTSEHERCVDELICNGTEYCDTMLGCQPGIPAQDCNDHDPCSIDICMEPTVGQLPDCEHLPMDRDGDGHIDEHCRVVPGSLESPWGDDCDDLDPSRHPGAGEFCFDGQDNDCDLLIDDLDEDCTLQNDTCDSAIELTPGEMREGFNFGALGELEMSCAWVNDPDVVYTFTVAEESDVTLDVWGDDFYPSLAIETVCGDVDSELACLSGGTNVRYFQRSMAPGTYYLVVKSWWEGTFRLMLSIDEPSPPPEGDTCETAIELTDGETSSIDLGRYGSELTQSCQSVEDDLDVAYYFRLDEAANVRYEVEGDGFTPYVSVGWSCEDEAGELVCDGSSDQSRSLCNLTAGTYFMVVSGRTGGALDVTVETSPAGSTPDNDTCAGAVDVSEGGLFPGTLLCTELDEAEPSCAITPSHDAFYTFTLEEMSDVELRLTAEDALSATLALTASCGGSDELFCERATEVNYLQQSLDPGTYFITVTGEYQADFELEVAFSAATSACDDAEVISESGTVSGTNLDAGDEFHVSCGNTGEGTDVPYIVSVPYPFDLRAEVTSAVSNTLLALRESCNDPRTELGCNDDLGGGANNARLELSELPAGSYSLVLDSWGWWGEGAYEIEVEILPVDSCRDPEVVTASTTLTGDSCAAPPIYSGSCGGDGPEAITTINLEAESAVRAEVTSAAFDSVLYLRSICDDDSAEVACDAAASPVFDLESLTPGRYSLFIDGVDAVDCGAYEISLTITE